MVLRSWVSSKYLPLENNTSQFTDVCQNGAFQLAATLALLAGYTTWVTQDRTWPACFPLNCSQSISNWIRSLGPPTGIFGKKKRSTVQKTERELVKIFLVIIRDKVAASILLKNKSTVKLCYEKLFGWEITSSWFSGSPLFKCTFEALYNIFIVIFIFLTVYLPHRCICWLSPQVFSQQPCC